MEETPKKVWQSDRCSICSTEVQKKRKNKYLEKVLSIFRRLSVWM